MTLGNTPRRQTVISLEARKSFAFGLHFMRRDTDADLDMTGATVRMIIAQPAHKGGAVLLTKTASALDLPAGLMQVELQAAELDLAEGEYPFDVTLVSANGYSTPVMKGVVDLRANVDLTDTNVYTGINPSTNLAVYLEQGDVVQVVVDKVDGLYVLVENRITSFTAEMQTQVDAAAGHAAGAQSSASSASASASGASTHATNAANSATAAAASKTAAEAAATSATSSASAAGGSAGTAQTAAGNAQTYASNAALSRDQAGTSATQAAASATQAASSATAAAAAEDQIAAHADAAAGSAAQASTSATSAETSAVQALTRSAAAADSATAAANSATAADGSKTAAATSATQAADSATTASTKASEASTSATNAATSATNAATSATNAAGSASAAATSETNAAASADSAAASAQQAESIVTGDLDPVIAGKVNDPASETNNAIESLIASTPASAHTHDDRYFTETETNTLLAGKSDTGHTHTKANITDFAHGHAIGDLPVAPSGTSSATQVVRADDSRLSDARTPSNDSNLVHKAADETIGGTKIFNGLLRADLVGSNFRIKGGGTDALDGGFFADAGGNLWLANWAATRGLKILPTGAYEFIGSGSVSAGGQALVKTNDARLSDARTPTAHTHPASELTATGTRDATTFLRGDNTWAVVESGAKVQAADPGMSDGALWYDTDEPEPDPNTFAGTINFGTSDTDVINHRGVDVETHTRSTTNTYTSGKLTQVVEKAGTTTVRTTTLTYTGDNLTQVVEVAGGKTITTTLTYTGSELTGTTRSVV